MATDRERAAKALDRTHKIGEKGPRTYNARKRLSMALDKHSKINRKDIAWLNKQAKKYK